MQRFIDISCSGQGTSVFLSRALKPGLETIATLWDDTDIYERLAVEELAIAATLSDYCTAKKGTNHARWHELVADPF
jgi:hypothetical protein